MPFRTTFTQRFWLWWTLKDIAFQNLALDLPLFRKEFEGLCKELTEIKGAKVSGAWAVRVQSLLCSAEENSISDPELAWRFAKAAERGMLFGQEAQHQGEADARACSLLEEAKEKIPGWRGKAIRNLLDRQNQCPARPLLVWEVVRAAKFADEHHDNAFRKLKILRKRLRLFGVASLIVTASYIVLAPRTGMLSNITAGGPSLSVLALAFMGLMGAVVSVLVSTKSISGDRVPVQQAQTAVLLGRLALGPLSALVVATFLATTIINGQAPSYNITLAAAFVSGFSERFVLQSIDTFSQTS